VPVHVSPEVGEWAEDAVCSVVLGDDMIGRQGMLMMDNLKMQIIRAIRETRVPKVCTSLIMLDSRFMEVFCVAITPLGYILLLVVLARFRF